MVAVGSRDVGDKDTVLLAGDIYHAPVDKRCNINSVTSTIVRIKTDRFAVGQLNYSRPSQTRMNLALTRIRTCKVTSQTYRLLLRSSQARFLLRPSQAPQASLTSQQSLSHIEPAVAICLDKVALSKYLIRYTISRQ